MTSPAQRHMMRVSAAMTAQREAAPLRHATVYEQMLVKLAADQRTLKAIYSKELKAAKKRELLPFWLPWVNGVLEQGKGAQDDILMTVMLWRLDTGDIAGALEIARYALKYGLTMPGKHRRTPPYMFTEEVALAAMRAHAAGESVDTRLLTETLELHQNNTGNHRDKTTEQHAPDKKTRGDGFTTGKHLADNNQHPNHEKRQDAFFFCCHALLPQIDSFSHGRGLNVGQFDGGAVRQHRPQFSQSRICGEHGLNHALSAPVIPDTNGVERVAL